MQTAFQCLTAHASTNPSSPDILFFDISDPTSAKNRQVLPLFCQYISDGQSTLSAPMDGPASLGYLGAEGFRPIAPFVEEGGARRVRRRYPVDGRPEPVTPFARRMERYYQVDSVGDWEVYVATVSPDDEGKFLVDGAGLLVQVAYWTLKRWRRWAQDAGFGNFQVFVAPWGAVGSTPVEGRWPWESDYHVTRLGYGEPLDFLEEMVAWLDAGNPLVIYPMTKERYEAWRAEDGEDEALVGSGNAYIDSFAYAWWPEADSGFVQAFGSGPLGMAARAVEEWWAAQGQQHSGDPRITTEFLKAAGEDLARALRAFLHEFGHLLFEDVFHQSSVDDTSVGPQFACPDGVYRTDDDLSTCVPRPNWCEGPMFTRHNLAPDHVDAMNQTYRFPEDAEREQSPISRHWVLDAIAAWGAGLLQHDVGDMMRRLHRSCCRKRFPDDDGPAWDVDPPWYGGLDYCLVYAP